MRLFEKKKVFRLFKKFLNGEKKFFTDYKCGCLSKKNVFGALKSTLTVRKSMKDRKKKVFW